ncbi:separin isoform X1 [Hermetia illucens]|uniref:separin isoform X1 n=2 Tax=Hermetia illucens TaxID=343691 RepID=UPI0018CC5B72|nr:separin isoform X1 [Hermetia illucens]
MNIPGESMENFKNLEAFEELQKVNCNSNTPYLRNIYLKQADIEYQSGNFPNSIFYQTEALCLGYRIKYLSKANELDPLKAAYELPVEELKKKNRIENALIKFAEKEMQNKPCPKPKPSEQVFETNPEKGFKAIRDFCRSLPKEWTVIQLCKSFNANTSASLKTEIITAQNSIYLSVLKNVQSDVHPDPICIKIETKENGYNIFESIHQITVKLKSGLAMFNNETEMNTNKVIYNKNLHSVDEDIKQAIGKLKELIGPWRCFFSGPALPDHQPEQNEIFDKVKQFSVANGLDSRQQVILSSLARQIHQLSRSDINVAVSELGNDSELSNRIKKFLIERRQNDAVPLKCFPCILIVDERLDHFFWEIINEKQELCRINSLHTLKSIYSKYAVNISDGYLKLSIENCAWILNPDKTLNEMERRISSFIEFWNPKIKSIVVDRKAPTADTVVKYITESDLYVYSGHGSGLQFFNGHKITNLQSKSVVFLLGCDSVRLKSDGWHSEMTGSHLYYFATQCPAVIGTILVAFDRRMDSLTSDILSTWIPSRRKVHWKGVDKAVWVKQASVEVIKSVKNERLYEPRLPLIMCKLRQEADSNHSRVYCVYRGLPVWNLNVE